MMKRVLVLVLVSVLFLVGCSHVVKQKAEVNEPTKTVSGNKVSSKSTLKTEFDKVLRGDLSPFAGKFSNDAFNQEIVDSDFTLGGYTEEDYLADRTSVFPELSSNGFWNGFSSHGMYEVSEVDLPYKKDGYYIVTLHGTNAGAGDGVLIFNLVPPHVAGPDGRLSPEKRVFRVDANDKLTELNYQKANWWQNYTKQVTEMDLDIDAINNGDFASLAGTWANGRGNLLVISADGTTSYGDVIVAVPNSDRTSKVPYALFGGGAVGLFKVGFENPYGDRSDTTRARLVLAQTAGDYEPELYFYRQQ